jgi:hypothetical protein
MGLTGVFCSITVQTPIPRGKGQDRSDRGGGQA